MNVWSVPWRVVISVAEWRTTGTLLLTYKVPSPSKGRLSSQLNVRASDKPGAPGTSDETIRQCKLGQVKISCMTSAVGGSTFAKALRRVWAQLFTSFGLGGQRRQKTVELDRLSR